MRTVIFHQIQEIREQLSTEYQSSSPHIAQSVDELLEAVFTRKFDTFVLGEIPISERESPMDEMRDILNKLEGQGVEIDIDIKILYESVANLTSYSISNLISDIRGNLPAARIHFVDAPLNASGLLREHFRRWCKYTDDHDLRRQALEYKAEPSQNSEDEFKNWISRIEADLKKEKENFFISYISDLKRHVETGDLEQDDRYLIPILYAQCRAEIYHVSKIAGNAKITLLTPRIPDDIKQLLD